MSRSAQSRPAIGLLTFLVMAGAAQAALAHDFWIEPSSYHPPVASSVQLALRVGEDFSGRPVLRSQDGIERFVVSGPRGERTVTGLEARDPAGFVRIDAPGVYVAGYQSRRWPITLVADRFERYLAAEGLDAVLEVRRLRGESRSEGREVFSRCAKTVLATSSAKTTSSSAVGGESAASTRLGCPFEIVLEAAPEPAGPAGRASPATPAANNRLSVKVLYQGRPIEGIQVAAQTRGPDGRHLATRSNEEGLAEFLLDRAGPWLIKAVHMVEAPDEVDADWESFWASLTLEAPEPREPLSRAALGS